MDISYWAVYNHKTILKKLPGAGIAKASCCIQLFYNKLCGSLEAILNMEQLKYIKNAVTALSNYHLINRFLFTGI